MKRRTAGFSALAALAAISFSGNSIIADSRAKIQVTRAGPAAAPPSANAAQQPPATSAKAKSQKPFSHRLHLSLNLECAACHPQAVSSTRKADNLLPAKAACAPCHAGSEMSIKAPRATMVDRFNHQLHLKLGNMGPVIRQAIESKAYLGFADDELKRGLNTKNSCQACHRGLERSESVTKAAFPAMADCLVCHSKIDLPFSCEQCHAPDAKLRPASHTADFVDLHSSGKLQLDKQSCAVCHGRQFTCQGCH